jgi:L-threonylcarbamoyladenylate synthase
MKTEVLRADHPVALRHAADILQNGGLVAFPTDTVYGLAALPFQSEFVERLYSAKGRSSERAIAILLGDISQLTRVAQGLTPEAMNLAKRFWPGPLTLIVPRLPEVPEMVSPYPTIGVRIPDHPVALALLRQVGPLAVTSANLSGQENANTAEEVLRQLQGRIHLILDGGTTPGGVPSTVADVTGKELTILRQGPISLEEIRLVLAR